jgi:hypothetical protein
MSSLRPAVPVVLAAFLAGAPALAGNVRGTARTKVTRSGGGNVNRNTNVNRNVNVNHNVNVHRDVDVNVHHSGGYYGGYHGGCCYNDYHPVATAAAVTATAMVTAAVIGSIVNTVPAGCSSIVVNGIGYQQCGSTWYQPQFSGTQTTYIVVNPPR